MTELSLIAKASAILGLALLITRAARRAPASVRALILATTFGLLLVLPIASALAPPRELQLPGVSAPAFFTENEAAGGVPLHVVAATNTAAAETTRFWRVPSVISLARGLWVLGVVVTLAPLLLGLWRSRTIQRGAHAWADGAVLASTLRDSIGLRRRVSVVLHDDLVSPMTCGWRRPTIVMPADSMAWPTADVRQALLHELEHVRRHDWAVHILARFTCTLYWFHPGAWIAWRQLALESERACDDAVVTRAENAAYAEQLVTLARRFGTTVSAPLLSMADRRTLATRVAAILNRNISRGRVGAGYAAAIMLGAAALSAGISPLHAVVRVKAAPDSTARGHAFEVASIRRNLSAQQGQTIALQGNTFVARNVTARELVMTAFRARSEDLSGGPGWLDSERYDVLGRPSNESTWEEHLSMVQRLLVDRFKLTIRRETRQSPVYELVVDRNGPTLTPAADANCTAAPPSPKCGGFATRPGFFDGRRVTVAQVASLLSGRSGRLVVNRTGIEGFYDVRLTWTPDASRLPRGPGPDDARPFDPSGPSLFAAIQEQLGLRLEPATAEIDHFVIEHIERPTPNDAPELVGSVAQSIGDPTFEVATVRQNTSGSEFSRGPMVQPGNRLLAQNVAARAIIATAYGLQWTQIVGGPGWLNSEYWDVEARARETASVEDVGAMLRTLLAKRFGLVAHYETRQQEVYTLTRTDSRRPTPGLRTAEDPCASIQPARPGVVFTPRSPPPGSAPVGEPVASLGNPPRCQRMSFPGFIGARQIRMPEFATMLTWFAGRPVIDRSNMAGDYDIDLTFAPDPAVGAGDAVSLFTAVQEQLGLKLEATRGPVEVLVIDAVERPMPN
jgi:uncharacterized protein (TIGR03435 family)